MSPPAFTDQILHISCEGQSMLGILSMPQQPEKTAVLVIVGGPQYRVGSHRQFVQMARHLASKGFAVLRFDYRGMGDSSGEPRNFESIDADVGAAVDALLEQGHGAIDGVVLWGLCDGASASLMYLHATNDPRIKGLFLMNPWVRSAQTLNETHVKHYYRQRLMEAEFWRKLLRGGIRPDALGDFLRSAGRLLRNRQRAAVADVENRTFQAKMLAGWKEFAHPVRLILSGRDLIAQEFKVHTSAKKIWQDLLTSPNALVTAFPMADHTFSELAAQTSVSNNSCEWVLKINADSSNWHKYKGK